MKKYIALLLALVLALGLIACGNGSTPATTAGTIAADTTAADTTAADTTAADVEFPAVMTYAEYVAAAVDAPITVECYVQATQGWWDNAIVIYAQDKDGAYFSYGTACSEEDAAKLIPGTKIQIQGFKAEWDGEVEIVDGKFTFVENADTYVAEPLDITELLASDELITHMNKLIAVKGAEIKKISYKNEKPGDDIYITTTVGDTTLELCVEVYLTGTESDVYKTVADLKEGDKVDIEGFLYWYNGANPHVTKITKN